MPRPAQGVSLPCVVCGKPFYRHQKAMAKKYCSRACYYEARRAERFNDIEGTAKCAKCNEWKPIPEFVKGRDGRPHSYCKPCSREWFEARRRKQGMKARRPANSPEWLAYRKQYKRELNRLAHHTRREAGPMPHRYQISSMLCAQDGKCAYCGEVLSGPYHIDHKTPIARGGTNDIENLHLTCPRCNLRKATLTHEEFLVSKRRRPFRQAGPWGKLP